MDKTLALQIYTLGVATASKAVRHALDPETHFEDARLADVLRGLKNCDDLPQVLVDWLGTLGVRPWKAQGKRFMDAVVEALAVDAECERLWTSVLTIVNSAIEKDGDGVRRRLSREDKEQFIKAVRSVLPPRAG